MVKLPEIVEIQEETERVIEKKIFHGKEITENTYGNRSETEFTLVEDPLNMHRTTTNETTLASKAPNMINNKNVIIAPRQRKL